MFHSQLTIKQDDVAFDVNGSSQSNPGFLPTTQRDTFFADFRLVPVVKQFQVRFEATIPDNLLVSFRVVRFAKEDVGFDRLRQTPTLLRCVADSALARKMEERVGTRDQVELSGDCLA